MKTESFDIDKEIKTDYRYEIKNEARDFYKQKKAFIILIGALEFLPEGFALDYYYGKYSDGTIIRSDIKRK